MLTTMPQAPFTRCQTADHRLLNSHRFALNQSMPVEATHALNSITSFDRLEATKRRLANREANRGCRALAANANAP